MLLFCAVCTVSMTFAQEAKKKKDSVTFFIEAMDCDHCIKKIEKNIAFEKGVTDLKCDLSTRTAIVLTRRIRLRRPAWPRPSKRSVWKRFR